MATEAPVIVSCSWGTVDVRRLGRFKDVKLWPGGGREWDWNETGTRHRPGIQPADAKELVDQGAETIVLGAGMTGALQVGPDTLRYLEDAGVEWEAGPTDQMVVTYNRMAREGRRVGALLHTTC